jgi:endoglucanase
MFELIKSLCAAQGISGREKPAGELIRSKIAPFVDETRYDAMGNLIALKRGTKPEGERKKLMFAAHMDIIGFIVTFIEENGYVRFATIGGVNLTIAAYRPVVFEGGAKGVIVNEDGGSGAADKMYVDLGTSSKKESEKKVKIGEAFIIAPNMTRLAGGRIAGNVLDDRVACAVLIEAASMAKDCPDDVYYVFTVQEEVGCRGSKTAAYAIAPDLGVAVDVTGTGDVQGAKPMAVKLGGGAAIKIKDGSVICDSGVVERLETLAKEKGIKWQPEILLYGGTDTSSIQMSGAGVPAGCISIPSRYIHTPVETADLADIKACAALAAALAEAGV